MFVGGTFLSFFDRTSPRTILTGKTGSVFGLIGTAIFIVVSFLLFIGPIIYYFKGDYIQGSFNTFKFEVMQRYTGHDFKLAIIFRNKLTNKIANHTRIQQLFKARALYASPTQTTFYSNVDQCYDQYFSEMNNKNHVYQPQDCFIIPNDIAFRSEFYQGASSIIGFTIQPSCLNPFACTFQSNLEASNNNERLKLFQENYYVVYFSGEAMDQWGNKRQQFYEVYSTEFQTPEYLTSDIYNIFHTQKYHMDNSIMPWYNNQTVLLSTWRGSTDGAPKHDSSFLVYGVGAFIAYDQFQSIIYRQYKKLDWLLGMLGGGIFIIYLIIWIPCKHINTIKNKLQIVETMTLIRNDNSIENVEKPSFGFLWKLSTLLPWYPARFKKQNKTIYSSQKLLDVAQLVKKLKVASRNLARTNQLKKFEPRILQFDNYTNSQSWSEPELDNEIKHSDLEQIKQSQRIQQIYSNHLPMLRFCNNQKSSVSKKINHLMGIEDQYSKFKIRKFQDRNSSKCSKVCETIKNGLQKGLSFFDVFGSKPNLLGSPQNHSMFGCIIVLLITVLSVLTFALTIHNMGVIRPYWDSVYRSPEQQKVDLIGGETFKLALCLSNLNPNYTTGSQRYMDIKFYQYTRDGTQQEERLFTANPLLQANSTYFDIRDPSFTMNLYSCFAVQDGLNYSIYGNSKTEKEANIGIKILPYCGLSTLECTNTSVQRLRVFNAILQQIAIRIIVPKVNYYPEEGKVLFIPAGKVLFSTLSMSFSYQKPVTMTLSLDTLQIIDNYNTWTMGKFPDPTQKYISSEITGINQKIQTSEGTPAINIKLVTNGVTNRVIFHSTKIDMFFATVGGIFIFFWFCFSCFSKFFNHYNFKAKLAETLYTQDRQGLSTWKIILQWLRIPCCSDRVMHKIEEDIENINIAKNVDNIYRLSVCQFEKEEQKNLALIYLKQRIKSDETIIKNVDEDQSNSEEDDDDFEGDWEIQKALQKKRLTDSSNAIDNQSDFDANRQIQVEKQHASMLQRMQKEQVLQQIPNSNKKCSYIHSFDFFNNNSQLTLDGKRSIQSVFGGICCILLFVLLCVMTSHFLTVYFSNWHRVSLTEVTSQDIDVLKMDFTVGQNFKLAVSFCKLDDFSFMDVDNLVSTINIALVKYVVTNNNGIINTTNQTISLVRCERSYVNGFLGEYEDQDYYTHFNNAYCVPDGTKMSLYGKTGDQKRQYFSIRINNKNNNVSLVNVKNLLGSYVPRYHISSPVVDYNADGDLRYAMKDNIKTYFYQTSYSSSFNVTMNKNLIQYDTAVNPTNQRPSMSTYDINTRQPLQKLSEFPDPSLTQRYTELNFFTQDIVKNILIQTIKVNQLFGIIGGCILFFFFGVGCIPRSYNEFKMRYLIGTKLYIVMGQKRIKKPKHKHGKLVKTKTFGEQINFSQWKLMQAWVLSFLGFMRKNFDFSKTLRYATLIQSRVTRDINTFELLKALFACESSIKELKIINSENINLCRVFPKQIISVQESNSQKCLKMIQTIKQQFGPLVDATRVNKFSDWELYTIIKAKQANVNIADIFNQKWLDRLMGLDRSTIGSMGGRSSHSGYRKAADYFKNRLPAAEKKLNSVNHSENESESKDQVDQNKYGKLRKQQTRKKSRKSSSKSSISSQENQGNNDKKHELSDAKLFKDDE